MGLIGLCPMVTTFRLVSPKETQRAAERRGTVKFIIDRIRDTLSLRLSAPSSAPSALKTLSSAIVLKRPRGRQPIHGLVIHITYPIPVSHS